MSRAYSGQQSFAFETTPRQDFAIGMCSLAWDSGFDTQLHYIAAPIGLHVARVTARALAGGHAASEQRLREMHAAGMGNLTCAPLESPLNILSSMTALRNGFVHSSKPGKGNLFASCRQSGTGRTRPSATCSFTNLEPHRAHQRQSIPPLNHAGAQGVVE